MWFKQFVEATKTFYNVSRVPLDMKNYFAILALQQRFFFVCKKTSESKKFKCHEKCLRFNELTYESGDHFIVAIFCTAILSMSLDFLSLTLSLSLIRSFAAAVAPRDIITLKLLSIGIKSFWTTLASCASCTVSALLSCQQVIAVKCLKHLVWVQESNEK